MLLILEGVDGSGKTTLAHQLQDELGGAATILHRGPPTKHPLQEYVKPLEAYQPGSGQHVICDRWHVGELVWPYIFERSTQYTDELHRYVEAFLTSRGAVVVACRAPARQAQQRVLARGEAKPKLKMLQAASRQFDHAFKRTSLVALEHSVERPAIHQQVLSYGRTFEKRARELMSITPELITENLDRVDVLFVGDRHGPGRLWPRSVLPFAPYPNTCGEWLLNALPMVRCALTNATIKRGQRNHLPRLWDELGEPRVVALGREAEKVLCEEFVEFEVARHPQYAKRFRHRFPEEYAVELAMAAKL